MKKILFALLGLCLLAGCESPELAVINISSASLAVGDSLYVSINNTPNNKAYFSMMNYEDPICDIKELSDTSAMLYAKKVGTDKLNICYTESHLSYTSTESIYIPIEVH